MKRHSLDDESTHPGSLIAGSRLPPKRGLTWPGSTLVPSYSVESDYAPGPWSAAAAAADEAAAELDPVRAAPEAISRSQPDFGAKRPLSPFKQRVAQARAQELIDEEAREGELPREALVEDQAQAVDVALLDLRLAPGQLGAGVFGGVQVQGHDVGPDRPAGRGQPEVAQLDPPLRVDPQALGGELLVDDARGVQR